jgi:opacity protein-like surface antigen
MCKIWLCGVSFVALMSAVGANAADMRVKARPPDAPPPLAAYNWTGWYAGVNTGASWGSYDPVTSTSFGGPAGYLPASLVPAVNAAGPQSINPNGFTGGSQIGYNRQFGQFVVGFEADLDYLQLNGAANGGAVRYPGFPGQFVISSYGNSNWLFTLRPRIGLAQNNWLFYATGGLALTNLNGDFLFTDSFGAIQSARIDNVNKAGYAVGGGIEWGFTDRLSLKAEYLYVNFNRTAATQTSSNIAAAGFVQPFSQSADLAANLMRVGFNYKLGVSDPAAGVSAFMPMKTTAWPAPGASKSDWAFDVGSRTWFSTGTIGAPQPLFNNPQILASRLIYKDLDAWSGETFARVDHVSGYFVKGFLGAGRISKGTLNDEDFPGDIAYSNTLSSASGNLAYANIDGGFTFLKVPGAKLGAFAGYNYYTQHVNTYSCAQLAGDDICLPGAFPINFLGIAEDDRFNSLRVGLSTQFMLTDRLKFTGDFAYLPWVDFKGQDDHNARQLLLPEASHGGNGVMLEGILDYNITNNWHAGVGARYWAWNTRNGTTTFNFLGAAGPPLIEPARFNTERYGFFLQTGYRWGNTTPAAPSSALMPVKAPVVAAAPMNWTGIYIGGHLGGGWSDDHWSDPFGSAPSGFGAINIGGFGDTIHSTGPLGGGQVGINWQTGQWVFGVQGDVSATDLRGDNTCFSGLGGINCQHIVNSISTVTGRIGFAWNRSLLYAKAGGAWTDTTYNLNGNTFNVTLGTGTTGITASGSVVGGGVEYALTDRWTTMFEYDHVDIGSVTVPFPSVAVVNAQAIGVKQTIDTFKLGANYKIYSATRN